MADSRHSDQRAAEGAATGGAGPAAGDLGYRQILESMLEGVQIVSPDFRYLFLNTAAVAHARQPLSALLGRTMAECYPGFETTEVFARIARCMRERTADQTDNEFEYPDGSKGTFELRFEPVAEGLLILSIDTTARTRAQAALRDSEERLRQSQRMEAIGQLAGGVAHDFNNVLSVILSSSVLALDELEPDHPARSLVVEIRAAAERSAALTRQLLAFGRRQVLKPEVLSLNEALAAFKPLMRRLVREDIDIVFRLAPDLGPVHIDPTQIDQILSNLVVNARDAMPRGGRLTVETSNVVLDQDYAAQHADAQPGPHVVLAITDTGQGMDAATRRRAFEPFFTTKPAGAGTGLGLATVYGIVKQSGGNIWIYSEPGQGTVVKLYLPRAEGFPAQAAAAADAPAPVSTGETILVVEDEDAVRSLAVRILSRHGFTVLSAAGVDDAEALVRAYDGAIDVLLSDMIMPGAGGPEGARRLRPLRPAMKVLFMSGYSEDALSPDLRADAGFIEKPFTPASLLEGVLRALGRGPA